MDFHGVTTLSRDSLISTYMALSGAVIFWGLSFVATKIALESVPTFTLVFIRFSLAATLLTALTGRQGFPSFTRTEHLKMFLLALFEPGFYFIFETIGLQYTTAPKTALIIATVPLATLIFSVIFIGERTSLKGVSGVSLSLIGITVLVAGDPQFKWDLGGRLFGDLLIFGAVISAAIYFILARNLGQNHSPIKITNVQFIYGTIFYLPAFVWELPGLHWSAISSRSLGALVYLTLLATVGAFLCYNYALSKMPASRAAVFINGIPVVTALGAWLLLGETLTLTQAGGGVLVLFAVALTNLPGGRGIQQKLH